MASPSEQPQKPNLNFRNPVPLSATQEAEVRQLYYKRVRGHCADEIKGMVSKLSPVMILFIGMILIRTEFAACAVNRTITATWVCRQQRLAMNACMVEHAKPEEEDRAREEWFATHQERRKAKEEESRRVEERRADIIRLMREDEARSRKSR